MINGKVFCETCGIEIKSGRSDKKYCSVKCGNKKRVERYSQTNRKAYLEGKRRVNNRRRATPQGKYLDHKHRAKQSGIEFKLSFEEWWNLWEPHWHERGIGGKVMCRANDEGAYELGNVRIDTQSNNNIEAVLTGGRSDKR